MVEGIALTPMNPTFTPPMSRRETGIHRSPDPTKLPARSAEPLTSRSLASSPSPAAQSLAPGAKATSPIDFSAEARVSAFWTSCSFLSSLSAGSRKKVGPTATRALRGAPFRSALIQAAA